MNKQIIIESDHIYLRKVTCDDVTDAYHGWMNDSRVTQFLEIRFQSWSKKNISDYVNSMAKKPNILFLAICLKRNSRHIGNIKLGPINRVHGFAEIGIIIGDKECWGKGLATETIALLTEYAFKTLDLNRVSAGCYENHMSSLKAFEKVGFQQEGLRRKMRKFENKYIGQIVMGMLKEEWIEKYGR